MLSWYVASSCIRSVIMLAAWSTCELKLVELSALLTIAALGDDLVIMSAALEFNDISTC